MLIVQVANVFSWHIYSNCSGSTRVGHKTRDFKTVRKLAIAAAVSSSLATFSVNSLALGLGDIEMYSALNQALDAEINILSASPGELDSVQVRIAPNAAFASAGLEKTPILSAMKFNIERRADGSPIIKVTSDAPVIEPFLNFLIEIDSDVSGRQVREFTVLLDPPVFTTQQTQLPDAVVAESQVVNIEEEIGASSPIIRSDIIVGEVVLNEEPLGGEIDEGEVIDLSQEIEVSDEVFETVDLAGADSVVISVDDVDSAVVETSPLVAGSQSNVITTTGGSELLTSADDIVAEAGADEGELIPLDAALLNSVSPIPTFTPTTNADDDGGELINLDDLNATGQPIFENEAEISGAAIAVSEGQSASDELDEGARVDLTDLLPVELVEAEPEADVVDTELGVEIDLDGLAPVGADSAIAQPVVSDALTLNTTEPVDTQVDLPAADESELVDLSSLQGSTGIAQAGQVSDQAEVIVDSVEVFTDTAALDSDATGSDNQGVEIDLSGILSDSTGTQRVANAGDTITVGAQDTLWSIAEDNKPSGVTTQQMMVALLESNQGAFLNGDMNQMLIGSVLEMPAAVATTAVTRADALAMVREQIEFQGAGNPRVTETAPVADATEDNSALPIAEPVDAESTIDSETAEVETATDESTGLSILGVDDAATASGTPATDELNAGADLSRDLDDVNRRVQLAQEELASEAMQRDELQGRVDDLASSMTKMKRLITLRESELSDLQTGVTPDTDAADTSEQVELDTAEEQVATEPTDATLEETQARIKEMQEKISDEATLAQDRIAAQADADKNLAAAEAEAQRIRVANEEDQLKLQLATLRAEKADLEETAQLEKAELVRAAEAEKTALLEQAQAEKERIQARLEEENARITAQAEEEKLAIAAQASAENERLIAEANAERERLAAESEKMRVQLEALEQEKNQLLAQAEIDKQQLQESADENLRLQAEAEAERQRADDQARIRERLAEEQAKAAANLATADASDAQNAVERTDTSAITTTVAEPDTDALAETTDTANALVEKVSDTTSDLAGKGAVAVGALGGLMSYAPLQKVVGNRTRTLATGGGIALLGLLASWAWRRRSRVVKEDINIEYGASDVAGNDRGSSRMHDDASLRRDDTPRRNEGVSRTATVATAATAATAAAAAVRESDDANARAAGDNRAQDSAGSLEAARNDGGMQDDTLTEAEVYLRYGLHGQAEELLTSAVERDPDNQDYHIKLLENYHDQKNTNGFKAAATTFQDRFGPTSHWPQIAEMGRDLDPGDALYSRASAMDISSAATGAVAGAAATGAAAVAATISSNDSQAGTGEPAGRDAANVSEIDELADDFLTESVDDALADLDDTIDPGAEFDLSELDATGQFDSSLTETAATSLQDVTLDEIDLAALDDDGTLNLEEVAGEEMSGLDLGALDFGDVDGDSSLDNLTLDDANLNSLDDMTTSLRGGLESDLGADDLDAGLSSRVDEMETMLDLAKAYIDMGDNSSAIGPLKDIAVNGSPAQQSEATELLRKIT